MMTPLTPFERLVLRALWALLRAHVSTRNIDITQEIDEAIASSDGQQRADKANKDLVP